MSDTKRPLPGASLDGDGVRFRLLSRRAEAVDLCLFEGDREEVVPLSRSSESVWEAHVSGLGSGARYGYRVHGPWDPARGDFFNPNKLLCDPRALAVTGEPRFDEALLGPRSDDPSRPDERNSAPWAPRSVVVDRSFDWGDDRSPDTPWSETRIYECHVRGMTERHPDLPEALRGTYGGLASEPILEHLRSLGVTAVELLPVHQIASEPHLTRQGRRNYFGYSPLAFMAPHTGYATSPDQAVEEFKAMVRRLHAAGIEVLIDVVLNHTAEGDPTGPLLSLRGIDNHAYYRLRPGDPGRYVDVTGCGNALDPTSDICLDLMIDTLEYWVDDMHVDGFRFDLAVTLARDDGFDPRGRFLRRIAEHPRLSRVKLVAEPWDLGEEGYQLGRFPAPWREWNDRYRDAARDFWRGRSGTAAAMQAALTGSPSIFGPSRPRGSSIDFVTCHDGFTLEDLVSYDRKHNRDNGENNRDGRDENLSRNWGVEGATEDGEVLAARHRAKRNFLATLALTGGVPMLSHGDELGRTQRGNNNAYCQDSELTWVDWDLDAERRGLLDYTRRVFALRGELDLSEEPRIYSADGRRTDDLTARRLPLFALWRSTTDGGLLMLLNATDRSRLFRLPRGLSPTGSWRRRLASFETDAPDRIDRVPIDRAPITRATVRTPAYSVLVLEALG